jgi:hypothetical protein
MPKKKSKHLRIDEGILNEFEKIAKRKKSQHNTEVEEMMKQYIALDGQMLFDELYAPRLEHVIKRVFDQETHRIMGMLYNVHRDATAALYANPIFHNKILEGVEKIIESFIQPALLNTDRNSIAQNYDFNTNGKNAVDHLRKIAHSDIQNNKPKKQQQTEKTS